jgi:hypothetical protein
MSDPYPVGERLAYHRKRLSVKPGTAVTVYVEHPAATDGPALLSKLVPIDDERCSGRLDCVIYLLDHRDPRVAGGVDDVKRVAIGRTAKVIRAERETFLLG